MPINTVVDNCFASVQLVQAKPRTIFEISELLGISVQTSKRYLDCMVEEGLVEEAGHAPKRMSKRGRLEGPEPVIYRWVTQ
jgi:predicted ArsR family transcriptional regulator